ncbi:putative oxidoreductase [Cohnella thailandensis]|uniref:Iron-containing alcohol dehydrogenase family protein n=2 Tax=Cohnella thailandensis TaxID=557557 RepID=A0A841T6V6_9BACL|nr:iron-containing alcohol dehydrogenase family protein [Cohnella thailandensis]MBB6637800.1 iron-containing alcohol dehydrogenase family protein [Cohnella thailandensis]MBP1974021.1 putative oxidoreductase [Cohnella thailandensis]
MAFDMTVRGAPQSYVFRPGCWEELGPRLAELGIGRALVVHGGDSWRAAAPRFPEAGRAEFRFERYGGECTSEERDRLARIAFEERSEAIIGVGGGKLSDLAKAVAGRLKLPVVLLPTLAATCSAWTPLSIMYDRNGAMVAYEIHPRANALVLLDPLVLLNSPPELLAAGIGDTLAKWYEADVILSRIPNPSVELTVASFAARTCRDNLLRDGEAALAALAAGEFDDAFARVVETVVLAAGMVGGFGDRYARTAGAHSVHDGLTILPEAHAVRHGSKVAYGILVQLALEERWAEIDSLLPFYGRVGLPASLREMGLGSVSDERLRAVADRTVEGDASIHLLPGDITAERVLDAMRRLEAVTSFEAEPTRASTFRPSESQTAASEKKPARITGEGDFRGDFI